MASALLAKSGAICRAIEPSPTNTDAILSNRELRKVCDSSFS